MISSYTQRMASSALLSGTRKRVLLERRQPSATAAFSMSVMFLRRTNPCCRPSRLSARYVSNTVPPTTAPQFGKIVRRGGPASSSSPSKLKSTTDPKKLSGSQLTVKAGLPLVLFALLSAWVVSNAYGGKLRELEASQGKASKSVRQAAMEQEHEEMLERLNKIVATDFDNTKRIKRPEEILEERRKERERRNAWHRRLYRWVFRKEDQV